MNQSVIKPTLIQEVSLTGAVLDGDAYPEYKTDTFINTYFIERVLPTKRSEVMAVTVSGKVAYVLRKDIESYFPVQSNTAVET